jgi:ubiquinone/menaquinone biosynthesis C-methylase UbiE
MMSVRLQLKDLNPKQPYSSHLALAELIKNKTKIQRGNCLEIFDGNGLFGLALARITDLNIYMLDNSPEMLRRATGNIERYSLETRVQTLRGSIRQIPLTNHSMDLVVSRSSVFFWQNQVNAFREIYRVLAWGGVACIGGGFGKKEHRQKIREILTEHHSKLWDTHVWRQNPESLERKMILAGITSYEINCSDEGLWIIFRRPVPRKEVS